MGVNQVTKFYTLSDLNSSLFPLGLFVPLFTIDAVRYGSFGVVTLKILRFLPRYHVFQWISGPSYPYLFLGILNGLTLPQALKCRKSLLTTPTHGLTTPGSLHTLHFCPDRRTVE